MSQLKVNTIRHTGASSDAVTLASDGTCTAKLTNQPPGNRNLIINGACAVAQRSTAAVTDDNIRTVDRFYLNYGGTDNHPTQERHVLTSSDTGPWEKGFRYSYHVTNGDQTSGAGAGDDMKIQYNIEAQDIAQSGWDYTSASSYITLSFWVKSSVAQNFYGYIQTHDGSGQRYPFETGSLSANTWAKITKTIPGNSNITMDNDNGKGLSINLTQFMGTNLTGSTSLNTWAAWDTALRSPDQTSDWWTTNDATWEITGLQLEVGDVATDFEHRRYSDELLRCQRYCMKWEGGNSYRFPVGLKTGNTNAAFSIFHSVPMRALADRAVSHTISTLAVQSGPGGNQNPPTISLDEGGSGLMMTFIEVTNINSGGSNGDLWQTRVADSDWYLIVENEL